MYKHIYMYMYRTHVQTHLYVYVQIVILGTGWGALSLLQKLDQDDVNVTIVSPRSFFFYTPMLAGTLRIDAMVKSLLLLLYTNID
jgi:hypothetical protein